MPEAVEDESMARICARAIAPVGRHQEALTLRVEASWVTILSLLTSAPTRKGCRFVSDSSICLFGASGTEETLWGQGCPHYLVWEAAERRDGNGLFCSGRCRVPDLEVVEEAVFAHAAEFHLRFGRVGDAGGL